MGAVPTNESPSHRSAERAPRPRVALVALVLAQFLVVFNSTSANLALPDATEDLGLGAGLSAWFVTSYLLSFGGLLLLAGRLGDALGRKRLLVIALAVFGTGAAVAGLAPSSGLLLGGRFVQGIGAAGIGPMVLALLTSTFTDPAARRHAFGVWGAVASAGAGFGVLGGGALTAAFGWRAVLLINLPIAVLLLIAVTLVVTNPPQTGGGHLGATAAVLSVLGVGSLIAGLTVGDDLGFLAPPTLLLLGGGTVLLAVFVVVERRATRPFIPWHLLSRWPAVGGDIATVTGAFAMFPTMLFASVLLQTRAGLSPLAAGLMMLPTSLATVLGSTLTSRVVAHHGPRSAVLAGLGATATAVLGFAVVASAGTPLAAFLPVMIVFGAGLGMTITASTTLALSGALPAETGAASGLLQTGQQLGGAVSLTLSSTIAAAVTSATGSSDTGYGVALAVAGAVAILGVVAVATHRARGPHQPQSTGRPSRRDEQP